MPARRYFTGWHRSTWLLVLESGVTRGKRITSPMYHPLNVRLILCAGGQRVGLLFFSSWPGWLLAFNPVIDFVSVVKNRGVLLGLAVP